jgi:HSP20 family protein
MSIVRWEPLRDFMTLREAMDRLFEESFVGPRRREWLAPAEGTLALDVYQTEDAVVVKTAVPGMKPDDIDITIRGNTLTISGETKVEEEVKKENYIRRERRYGSFSRSVVLPEGVSPDEAEASFEDGILVLTVPKAPEAKPKVIKVKSKKE